MKHLIMCTLALSAAVALPSIASAQTVDISGAPRQTANNIGSISNKGIISIDDKVDGAKSSVVLSTVGAANDASITFVAPAAKKITSSLAIQQSAVSGATSKVTTSGRVTVRNVTNGGSISVGAVGAANSLSTSVTKK